MVMLVEKRYLALQPHGLNYKSALVSIWWTILEIANSSLSCSFFTSCRQDLCEIVLILLHIRDNFVSKQRCDQLTH